MGRLQTGFTLAGLALTAAVFTQGYPLLAGIFVGLTLLIIVGTLAPHLPGLHRIPKLGAPEVRAKFSLNGRDDLVARLPAIPNDPPRTVHLQIGLHVPGRTDLQDATVTFLLPASASAVFTDHHGEEKDDGTWMPPFGDALPHPDGSIVDSRYWVATRTLFGRRQALLYFKLTLPGSGDYPIRVKVSANALYDDFAEDAVIHIEAQPESDERPIERVSAVIDDAEQLLGLLEAGDDFFRNSHAQLLAIYMQAHDAVPDDFPEGTEILNKTEIKYKGPKTGQAYDVVNVRRYLEALYEIRRRLGARENE